MERISERTKLEPSRRREKRSIHAVSDLRHSRKTRAKREWVPGRGVEPPRLSAHAPQACLATVTTPGQI